MKNNKITVIILAAGKGSRMGSDLPKVMHQVGEKPMLEWVLSNALQVTDDIILVYSTELEKYLTPYQSFCKFALQAEPLGTGDAARAALELMNHDKACAIIFGDNPLITDKIIKSLLDHLISTDSAVATLAFTRDTPNQYGKILTDEAGNFIKIVEYKDATAVEQKIAICNSGIMAFKPNILKKYLPYCCDKPNNQEAYLTDIIEICHRHGEKVSYLLSENQDALIGVNTKEELAAANNIIKNLKIS
jgi:UDP-N-acetylglucosamine pyrophosphorylase